MRASVKPCHVHIFIYMDLYDTGSVTDLSTRIDTRVACVRTTVDRMRHVHIFTYMDVHDRESVTD